MQIKLKDGNLKLYVSHFVNDHNHGLVPLKFVDLLRGHQRITEVDIAHMDNMRQVSISILKIYESIATQAGGFNMTYEVGASHNLCDLFRSDGRNQEDYVGGMEEYSVREVEWVKDLYRKKTS
ncbi:hypothetical protein AHAS_Ahas13G0256900 [Arachis hypogaea]